MKIETKLSLAMLLLASSSLIHADTIVVEGYVRSTSNPVCKAGLEISLVNGGVDCLAAKKKKLNLAGLEGELVKFEGEFKNHRKQQTLVVHKINPSDAVGTMKLSGFNKFMDAASPWIAGAAMAAPAVYGQASGHPVAAPAAQPVPAPQPNPTVYGQTTESHLVTSTTPRCVRTEYVNTDASLYVVNGCNVAVYTSITSDSGNTWGGWNLAPGQRSEATAFGIGYDPRKDGKIYIFTCPQPESPVMPNGRAGMPNNYKGDYLCYRP